MKKTVEFERCSHERAAAASREKLATLSAHSRHRDWISEFQFQTAIAGMKLAMFQHVPVQQRTNAMVRATETIFSPDGEEMIQVTKGHNRQVVVHMALNQDNAPGGRTILAHWVRKVRDDRVQEHLVQPLWGLLETRAMVRAVQPGLMLEDIVLSE